MVCKSYVDHGSGSSYKIPKTYHMSRLRDLSTLAPSGRGSVAVVRSFLIALEPREEELREHLLDEDPTLGVFF